MDDVQSDRWVAQAGRTRDHAVHAFHQRLQVGLPAAKGATHVRVPGAHEEGRDNQRQLVGDGRRVSNLTHERRDAVQGWRRRLIGHSDSSAGAGRVSDPGG